MHCFASGPKTSYYGKGDVTVYRLNRDGTQPLVFGASVLILIYGDAFWPTYTTGDNSSLVATDSMKNFIQRETLNFTGSDLESYCHFIAEKFLATYPQAEGAQVSASQIPYSALEGSGVSFAPAGPDFAHARLELVRAGSSLQISEARSGIKGFRFSGSTGARSRASCATSTPRFPISPIARCICGWIWTGLTPARPPRSPPGRLPPASGNSYTTCSITSNRGAFSRSFIKSEAACWPIFPQLRKSISRRITGTGILPLSAEKQRVFLPILGLLMDVLA